MKADVSPETPAMRPLVKMLPLPAVALTALVVVVGCGPGGAGDALSYELENGLDVLLRPIAGCDTIALVVLHDVGGHADPEGQSGLAHLIEHCYVTAQGGPTPRRTMDDYVRRYPDGWNAQTGNRYTVVAAVFPPDRLEAELRDAAARLGDLRITREDLDREVPRVVAELRNMYGGIPMLAAANLARERVLPSPRGGRRGGVVEDVEALTPEMLQQRWAATYRANNATLVLAGAIDPARVRGRVHYYFHTLPKGEPAPTPAEPPSPRVPATEAVKVEPAQAAVRPAACIAWKAPEPGDADYAAFLVLVGRLYQAMAVRASRGAPPGTVRYAPLDDPALFALCTETEAGADAAFAELQGFLDEALAAPLEDTDKRRARVAFWMLGTMDVPDRDVVQNAYGVALGLGRRHQLGLEPEALRAALDAVTAEDVARVRDTVLAADRRAAVFVDPR